MLTIYELELFKEETTFTQDVILKLVFNKDEQETIKKCLETSEVKEYVSLSQQIAKDHSLIYDEKTINRLKQLANQRYVKTYISLLFDRQQEKLRIFFNAIGVTGGLAALLNSGISLNAALGNTVFTASKTMATIGTHFQIFLAIIGLLIAGLIGCVLLNKITAKSFSIMSYDIYKFLRPKIDVEIKKEK